MSRPNPSILEDDQLEALLASAPMPFDLLLLLAARAGLRHQQILHPQVRDIDEIYRNDGASESSLVAHSR